MTTVIDPGTSGEAAVFNKSGTVVLNATISSGLTMTIPAVAGRVIVNLNYPTPESDPFSGTTPIFTIGSGFEIGDEVWVLIPRQPRGRRFDINFVINDPVGNLLLSTIGGGGLIKVANVTEVYAADGSTARNWNIMSSIDPNYV